MSKYVLEFNCKICCIHAFINGSIISAIVAELFTTSRRTAISTYIIIIIAFLSSQLNTITTIYNAFSSR
jgi:hypothetical protein